MVLASRAWHEACFLTIPMKTTRHPKLKKVLFNLAGICLVYAVCLFYGKGIDHSSVPVSFKFHDVIAEAAQAYDVHPALIAAVIHAESNFNPRAVSYAGAKGLMQINPPTQRHLKLKNAYDVKQNVDAGSRYLKELIGLFGGDISMALAAYNAGPGAVARYDGIPPYKETRAYVKKVLAYYRIYRRALESSALLS